MTTVKKITEILQSFAPEQHTLEGEYDNVGLLLGSLDTQAAKVLICLDVTEEVIQEAISSGAKLIISHHPFIYAPIKKIVDTDPLGKKIALAIKHNIAIYSAHTNLDFVKGGINEYAAELLELTSLKPLTPYISPLEGFGRVGELKTAIAAAQLKLKAAEVYKDSSVRLIGDPNRKIKRVTVLNGAGGGDTKIIDQCISYKADALVTAEVKHHVALYAMEKNFVIIEPQHFLMEHIYLPNLVTMLHNECCRQKLSAEIILASSETNPKS
ncbi:MAG: Nif3-like dinuclear metal center hexameric protein [Firmicutes bacterium]|nr:Nif3-like dinuclear metal center hexameric protein [Bacillota bacterium]